MLRIAIIGLLALFTAASASAETRLALLIGNEDYPASVGQLQNPHQDVDLMQAALTDIGFETVVLKDGDKTAIEAGIGGFIAQLADEEDAVAFFYYSGHGGSQEVRGRRKNYLIPSGSDITTSAQLPFAGVALDTIIDAIAASEVKAAFIVSDACRNTLAMAGASKGGAPADRSFGVEQRRPGLYIANATADGETAPDDGRFAKALSEQIRVSGQYAPRAFSLAFREVAKQREGYRLPSASDALNEDICFNGCPSDPVVAGTTRSPEELAEEEVWLEALSNGDEGGYEAYLGSYPDGRYAPTATAFLERAQSVREAGGTLESVPKTPVDPQDWPSVAVVRAEFGDKVLLVCSATMIAPRWAITETSCVSEWGRRAEYFELVPAGLATSENGGIRVINVQIHPDHVPLDIPEADGGGSDVALLEIERDWGVRMTRLPRSPASSPSPQPGETIIVAGFGTLDEALQPQTLETFEDGRTVLGYNSVLNVTRIPLAPRSHCLERVRVVMSDPDWRIPHDRYLCARPSSGGAGTCAGDGGAGVFVENPDGTRRLVGHVSYGAGCYEEDGFEVYANYAVYGDWIVDVIGAEPLYGNR